MANEVLVLTERPDLRDVAARWCAAVGATPAAVPSLEAGRRYWRSADAVVVGEDCVANLEAEAWPRRDDVHLLVDDVDRWWRSAVAVGAAGVLPAVGGDDSGIEALATVIDGGAEGCSIVVVGAGGGVGTTTLACSIAVESAARDLTVAVLDADPTGPGVDLVMGCEKVDGLRWSSLDAAAGRVSPGALAGALPRHHGVATLTWGLDEERPLLPAAAPSVWSAAVRGFDVVVVDDPVAPGDHGRWSGAVLGGSVLVALVIRDDVSGIAAARRRAALLRDRATTVVGVLARRRGGLGKRAVESAVGIPIVATMNYDRRLATAIDHGRGPGRSRPLRRSARDILDLVGLG